MEIIKRHNRLKGYVTINANYVEESKALVEEYVVKHGFVGVKIHPEYSHQPIDSPNTLEILETVNKLGVPILVHTYGRGGVSDPAHALKVVEHYPNLIIILGHMGGDNWRWGIEVASKGDTIYVDPCSCTQPHSDKIKEAKMRLGIERILFGTDVPFIHPAWALGMIESADITSKDREKILYDNARQIWKSI
jgi:predicted TIM-barrel fold metal-dependent hydrolase